MLVVVSAEDKLPSLECLHLSAHCKQFFSDERNEKRQKKITQN